RDDECAIHPVVLHGQRPGVHRRFLHQEDDGCLRHPIPHEFGLGPGHPKTPRGRTWNGAGRRLLPSPVALVSLTRIVAPRLPAGQAFFPPPVGATPPDPGPMRCAAAPVSLSARPSAYAGWG